jgi:signal transduction histidine kinase
LVPRLRPDSGGEVGVGPNLRDVAKSAAINLGNGLVAAILPHAHAISVEVRVTVDEGLGILIVDNGVGVGQPARQSGIANARAPGQAGGAGMSPSVAG